MDPNETLKLIADCATEGDGQGALEACTNLLEWFSNGGFSVGTKAQRDAVRAYFNRSTEANLEALARSFAYPLRGL